MSKRQKHILVTGGAGFIGSHLVERLLTSGNRVTVVDDESTGDRANLATVDGHESLIYHKASVADEELMHEVLVDVDQVYHLAAAVGVQLIASSPIHTIETNIYPTEKLLRELGRLQDRGRTVPMFLASTSEVYGKNPKPRWTEEDDLVYGATTRPRWSYGVSKAVDEFLALAYHQERGLPVVIGRFFNVVGPRQTGAYGMVLPRFVDAALDGGPLIVHDDGLQVRCFGHVGDVLDAVLDLMALPEAAGRVYNIGSDRPVCIHELARKVVARVDPNIPIEFQSYAEAYSSNFEDCRSRVPDLSRLKETIQFTPKYDLERVIDEVIAHKRRERQQES